MQNAKTAVVLGAGVSGSLMAWRLLGEGFAVDVFEARAQDDHRGAAYVAAAMLSPLAEAAASEAYIGALGLASMPLWEQTLAALTRHDAEPLFFQRQGTLVVWHPNDRAEAALLSRQLAQYVDTLPNPTATSHYETLSAPTIASLEPALAGRFTSALMLHGEGQVDNRQIMARLHEAIAERGGRIHWQSPRTPEQVAHEKKPSWIIDCRGLGVKADINVTKPLQGLRGIRGEVLRVHSREVTLNRPIRLLHPRYPLYIAPKPRHEFVIGATVIESEDESPISLQSSMELASALYAVHPAFAESRIVASMTSLRPTLPDHRPCIHLSTTRDTPILHINGLYRHGWLLAPIVVESALSVLHADWRHLPSSVPADFAAWQATQAFPPLFSCAEPLTD